MHQYRIRGGAKDKWIVSCEAKGWLHGSLRAREPYQLAAEAVCVHRGEHFWRKHAARGDMNFACQNNTIQHIQHSSTRAHEQRTPNPHPQPQTKQHPNGNSKSKTIRQRGPQRHQWCIRKTQQIRMHRKSTSTAKCTTPQETICTNGSKVDRTPLVYTQNQGKP